MKYQVFWKNNDREVPHGTYSTQEVAMQSIYAWWDKHGFEPRYVRSWTKDGVMWIDYGYHNAFYLIKEVE